MKYRLIAVTISLLLLASAIQPASAAETVVFTLQAVSTDSNGYRVDVTVLPAYGVAALQFRIGWEGVGMTCTKVIAPSFCGIAPVVNMDSTGVRYIWDALSPIAEDTVILTLFFVMDPDGEGSVFFSQDEALIAADNDLQRYAVETSGAVVLRQSENQSSISTETVLPESPAQCGESDGIILSQYADAAVPGQVITLSTNTDEKVVWSSSNEKVAIVSEDGTVTAVSPGEAVIMAETAAGAESATCVITVVETQEQANVLRERMGDITSPASSALPTSETTTENDELNSPTPEPAAERPSFWLYAGLACAGLTCLMIVILLLRKRKRK